MNRKHDYIAVFDSGVGGITVLRLTSMMGMANISFTKEELLAMNEKLNKIKAPKK